MSPAFVAPELRQIPIALIDEPALPSRTEMADTLMEELVASIRTLGFISVIVVVVVGERYRVVAGHRRTIAARRAGLAVLPCLIYPDDATALDAIQHAENRHREELSVTDEAIWFAQLLDAHPDEGTDGLAGRVGESRNYVEGRLALLQGCERVFRALADKQITIGAAQQLNRCTEDAHRFMLLDTAIRSGAPVGLVSQWVHEWRTIHLPASGGAAAPVAGPAGPSPIMQEYFRCRHCGETQNPQNMLPVQIHDYCLQQITDRVTGMFRSRADYVVFPNTREDAVALVQRVLERFPELADDSAART